MAATGSAKAESVAAAPSYPFTDLKLSRFFAHVELSRQRLANHPGHADQSSHGRKKKGAAEPAPDGQGKVGPQMSRLGRTGAEDIRTASMNTNPKFQTSYEGPRPEGTEGTIIGYTHNCTRVAIAYEMRRRGLDVTAGAGTPERGGDITAAYLRSFRQDGKYALRVESDLARNMTPKDIASEVESWPLGARGIVTMRGHTLNVERDAKTGKAVFIESQAAKSKNPVMTTAQFTSRTQRRGAPTDHMAVARVDDLDMSDYSLRYVEGPGLDIAHGQIGKTTYPQQPGKDHLPSDAELAAMTPDDTYP